MLLLALLLALAPLAHAGAWRAPVDGAVTRAFAYDRASAFARGHHRGIDLATRAGAGVAAPCTGTVVHAGRVPGRGRGVTLRCGALVATVLDLRATSVARGARVLAGGRVGRAAGRTVHLGARRAGDRFGYVAPPLAAAPAPAPFGPAPAPRPRRPAPRPLPALRATPVRAPAPGPGRVPALAWGGAALITAALPAGALWRRRARTRRASLTVRATP